VIDAPTAQLTIWEIDPAHAFIDFDVENFMLTSVKGRLGIAWGTIAVPGDDFAAASIGAELDVASINTGRETRDRLLRSADFLDVEQYPTIIFMSTSIAHHGGAHLLITGDLTICGITREVVLDTILQGRTVNRDGEELLDFMAKTAFNRKDFGLAWEVPPTRDGGLIGKTVQVVLEAQAIRRLSQSARGHDRERRNGMPGTCGPRRSGHHRTGYHW
jgi:polyisoprenoid-binding protein YceI